MNAVRKCYHGNWLNLCHKTMAWAKEKFSNDVKAFKMSRKKREAYNHRAEALQNVKETYQIVLIYCLKEGKIMCVVHWLTCAESFEVSDHSFWKLFSLFNLNRM